MCILNNKKQINKVTKLYIVILLGIFSAVIPTMVNATESLDKTVINGTEQLAQLKVTPKPCVALRKGQKCFLEVTFNWQHPTPSNYCLVNATTNKTMKCWQQQNKGEFSFDFQSTLSNDFVLRQAESTIDLARTKIAVAWVYKSSKRAKSTWRIF